MCKVAVLERFSLYGSGIKAILEKNEGIDLVTQAESPEDLVKKAKTVGPHVIIIDIIHCVNSGLSPLKKIRKELPDVPVLLITSPDYADCFEEYIRLGVKGFVFFDSSSDEFLKAINKLKRGEEFFNHKVWTIFKDSIQSRKYKKKKDKLTDREVSVLKLFSGGLSYKEIGVSLNISPRTVETHKRNILSKLNVNTTAEMIKYAYHHKMLT